MTWFSCIIAKGRGPSTSAVVNRSEAAAMRILVIGLMTEFLLIAHPLLGQETLYPPNNSIRSRYLLSADTLGHTATLTISRTIVNHTSFGLSGLYFSDNLPPVFVIVDQRVTVNGIAIGFSVVGPIHDQEANGCDTYFWIIDSRGEIPGIGRTLASQDSIRLEIDVRCDELGRFLLPAHAAVFYGNGDGYFSTSEATHVVFDVRADTGGSATPPSALRTSAYPNPFNAAVVITYAGLEPPRGDVQLRVFDPLGRVMHTDHLAASSDHGSILWRPDRSLSSGVYVYRISAGDRSASGKILLIR